MERNIFVPGDILIPQNVDMHLWSVIACDQFTSAPDYWERVEKTVGNAPSTLRLMLPEAYLDRPDVDGLVAGIEKSMLEYSSSGLFRTLENSYVFVERTVSGGGVRRGLLGSLDLECYDYSPDSASPIRATEGIVPERLPPRAKVRSKACLELPHIVVFIDDPDMSVIAPAESEAGETLYDFELMEGGGHIRGRRISGAGAGRIEKALAGLASPERLTEKYGAEKAPVIFAVGDGNHSLAAAKMNWETVREGLSEEQKKTHPARWTMVELVNLHDSTIIFEPIYRLIFNTDTKAYLSEAKEFFSRFGGRQRHTLTCFTGEGSVDCGTGELTLGECIAACEEFAERYAEKHGGRIDYIHGRETVLELGSRKDCAGILMPIMDKKELFPSITRSGALPKKSFSIGPALDKRYYLECRRIIP
ncbi:MAG: DUF1015 domain-containing protein [Oscillospiraceae bacterium]|nr:DUF1015 domain-containing protein [Oscillospiraceae bacterium]